MAELLLVLALLPLAFEAALIATQVRADIEVDRRRR